MTDLLSHTCCLGLKFRIPHLSSQHRPPLARQRPNIGRNVLPCFGEPLVPLNLPCRINENSGMNSDSRTHQKRYSQARAPSCPRHRMVKGVKSYTDCGTTSPLLLTKTYRRFGL